MHELSVVRSIVDIALAEAAKAGARRVLGVSIVVGDLSSVVDESARLYFGHFTKGTIAEGASLAIRRTRSKLRCTGCGKAFEMKRGALYACPRCGGEARLEDACKDLYIEGISVG